MKHTELEATAGGQPEAKFLEILHVQMPFSEGSGALDPPDPTKYTILDPKAEVFQ